MLERNLKETFCMEHRRTITIHHDNNHFYPKRKWSLSWPQVMVIIFITSLLFINVSCASRKKTVAPTQPQVFEWMTAKMDIQAEGNGLSLNDLSGQIRMRRDSLLWLSVTAMMGVEVVRAKVSNDSVWILNRLEKTYLAEPLDSVAAQFGLPPSLPLLQTLLLDNNEGFPPVENQTVFLKTFAFGNMSAKVKYNNIILNEKTTFPLKISDKIERVRIKPKK